MGPGLKLDSRSVTLAEHSVFFVSAPLEHQRREKEKARVLRKSQWWKNQLARGRCYYCEGRFSPRDLTLDHKVPIVRGGFSVARNCVPACKACNTQKGYKTQEEIALDKIKKP